MLSLRGIYFADTQGSDNTSQPTVSDIRFATVVGNLAAPLQEHKSRPAATAVQDAMEGDDVGRVEISSNPLGIDLLPQIPGRWTAQDTGVRVPLCLMMCILYSRQTLLPVLPYRFGGLSDLSGDHSYG